MARPSLLAAVLAAALGVAGCSAPGGGGELIPAPVATALAARVDAVSAALAGGDCAGARAGALALQADAATLDVTPPLRTEVVDRAAGLVRSIQCAPPPAPTPATVVATPPTGGAAPGPKKEKGHKGGHGHDD
ncbi:MAG TPA: hypothetical protein VGP90_00400 [Acidimicrobiia bacterium]|nr:hypothetical protein [Acidimicrobiia bacterium]